jgi:hypothetical protein
MPSIRARRTRKRQVHAAASPRGCGVLPIAQGRAVFRHGRTPDRMSAMSDVETRPWRVPDDTRDGCRPGAISCPSFAQLIDSKSHAGIPRSRRSATRRRHRCNESNYEYLLSRDRRRCPPLERVSLQFHHHPRSGLPISEWPVHHDRARCRRSSAPARLQHGERQPDESLEFFSIKVPDGPLTSRLQRIGARDIAPSAASRPAR